MRPTGVTRPRCGRGLDLAHGAGEHRDDAVVVEVAGAPLAARGGTASAGLALASSSQELLLWGARDVRDAADGRHPHAVPRPGRWDVGRRCPDGPSATEHGPTDLREIEASGLTARLRCGTFSPQPATATTERSLGRRWRSGGTEDRYHLDGSARRPTARPQRSSRTQTSRGTRLDPRLRRARVSTGPLCIGGQCHVIAGAWRRWRERGLHPRRSRGHGRGRRTSPGPAGSRRRPGWARRSAGPCRSAGAWSRARGARDVRPISATRSRVAAPRSSMPSVTSTRRSPRSRTRSVLS